MNHIWFQILDQIYIMHYLNIFNMNTFIIEYIREYIFQLIIIYINV